MQQTNKGPSFSSRLPELCDSLNRKLGGPPILVSPKNKSKPKASAKQPRPGAVTKRSAPKKPSLQRAFSTDQAQRDRRSMSRGPSKAVAALLSATEMPIPGLKKEGDDSQSPMSIPRMKSECGLLKSARSDSLSHSSRTAGEDSKQSTKAAVDAELQDAIAALRKPNRQLAGAAMAEEAEKRVGGGLSQVRSKLASLGNSKPQHKCSLCGIETKKPVRVAPADRVQVKATPMHNRYRDAPAVQSQPAIAFPLSRPADNVPPSSNPSVIPSTAPRRSFRDALQDDPSAAIDTVGSTPAKPAAADRIEGTPVKKTSVSETPVRQARRPEPSADTILGSSPLMAKRTAPVPYTGGVRNLKEAFKTPVKARPEQEEKPVPEAKVSIYEKLGWDNEYDDL